MRTNIYLNAVVATRFAEARKEAAAADAAVREGAVPADCPLWGVPFVTKECFEFPEMPYTVGIVGRKNVVGGKTTPSVAALQRAGGIVLASTNTSEGCMWHESSNKVCIYMK
jgi:fatty acid amide hydrolase 2